MWKKPSQGPQKVKQFGEGGFAQRPIQNLTWSDLYSKRCVLGSSIPVEERKGVCVTISSPDVHVIRMFLSHYWHCVFSLQPARISSSAGIRSVHSGDKKYTRPAAWNRDPIRTLGQVQIPVQWLVMSAMDDEEVEVYFPTALNDSKSGRTSVFFVATAPHRWMSVPS